MKIVIASDKFKGSITSAQVADAVATGIRSVLPDAELLPLALADGGEGTAGALSLALGAHTILCHTVDPLMRPIEARYGIADMPKGLTALIDMASSGGLALLADDVRNPMVTTTAGLGIMIADAYTRGCRNYVIGIGGSATCDGGMGMLSVLGVRFLNDKGHTLAPTGASLGKIFSLDMSHAHTDILGCDFTVLCDVANPLYGPDGAACVFAPQKGATPEQVLALDAGLRNYARILNNSMGCDVAWQRGAGAAGGLGAAFIAFFNAYLRSGADVVLDSVGFDDALANADLVITGEGHLDNQTLMGKLPAAVLRRASAAGVPVVAIAGIVDDTHALLRAGFAAVRSINERAGDSSNIMGAAELAHAMQPTVAAANIARTAADIVLPQ